MKKKLRNMVLQLRLIESNREKYLQLIIKQLKADHPELFLNKVSLTPLATEIVANARTVLAATPAKSAKYLPTYF